MKFIILFLILSLGLKATTKEDLLKYFPDDAKPHARLLLDQVYERGYGSLPNTAKKISIGRIKYPSSPETLEIMLGRAKGSHMIEFGCACGEIALLFVLAGAQSVVFNDIDKSLLETAIKKYNSIPKELRGKTKVSFKRGDCVLLSQKELDANKEAYSVVLARNLIHLLGKDDVMAFASAIEGITAPGGLINMTAHTIQSSLLVAHLMGKLEGDNILEQCKQGYASFYRHRFSMEIPFFSCLSLMSYYEPCSKGLSEASPVEMMKSETFNEYASKEQLLANVRCALIGNQKELVLKEFKKKLDEARYFDGDRPEKFMGAISYNASVQVFYTREMIERLFSKESITALMSGYFRQSMHFVDGDAENKEICSAEVVMAKK